MVKTLVTIILFSLAAISAYAQPKDRIKVLLSTDIPVEVSIESVTQTYEFGYDEPIYSIKYSLTNRADSIVSQVAFIEYQVDNVGTIGGTTFWSERDSIRPNETKEFSFSSSGDYQNSIGVWSITSICTEFGSMDLDLTGLESSVKSFALGGNLPLPRARGALFPKCSPELR